MSLRTYTAGDLLTPGLWRMDAATYHGDPCATPSLSSSIAHLLLTQSPAHAAYAHPRLRPTAEPREANRKMDLGSLAHALLLGQGRDIVEVMAADYRTVAARQHRDAIEADGKIPALTADLKTVARMAGAARIQLDAHPETRPLFRADEGDAEVAVVWYEQDEPISFKGAPIVWDSSPWCRGLLDWLSTDQRQIVDLKTRSRAGGAHPTSAAAVIAAEGFDLKFAFYERGLVALNPDLAGRIDGLFVFLETQPPYLLSVLKLDETTKTMGRAKVQKALDIWRRCVERNEWPGYSAGIQTAMLPGWAVAQWANQELDEQLDTGKIA